MKCQNCGNEITDNQKFCSNCGYKVNSETLNTAIQNNSCQNNIQQPVVNQPSTFTKIVTIAITIAIIFCSWKFYFQPYLFPNDLQKNGYDAEWHAKNYLGDFCKENELEVKAIEVNDGIYIVECKTTNSILKSLYGSTFYYGYMPMADGKTYKQHADKTISAVYTMLEK